MNSKNIIIKASTKSLQGKIDLTGSKSESNRALIINNLSDGKVRINNLSAATDTVTLQNILKTSSKVWDVGPAGTTMRFLAALAALKGTDVLLTGSERMQQRPIKILVDALRLLGAHITYEHNEGFPPLRIQKPLIQTTNEVVVPGNISSQYLSALLLIAPSLPKGLQLHIEGELTSKPYLEMTLSMLQQAGIQHQWHNNIIRINHQSFTPSSFSIEPDWSAASYWYAMAALANEATFFLPGLKRESLQGDCKIAEIMAHFGVTSEFKNDGIMIQKQSKSSSQTLFDFKDCPDLAQTVIVYCAALKHNAIFTGLETLKIKETNRVQALQNELSKIGVNLIEINQTYHLNCDKLHFPAKLSINTYHDHRMAMAFAPLVMMVDEIEITDYQVVAKSYPNFWNDLNAVGVQSCTPTNIIPTSLQ